MRPVRTDNGVYRPLGGEAALRVRRRTLRRVRGLRRRSVHCLLHGTSHSVQPPSRTQRRQSLRGLPASTLKRRRTASTSRHRNRDCLADTSWPQAGYRSWHESRLCEGGPEPWSRSRLSQRQVGSSRWEGSRGILRRAILPVGCLRAPVLREEPGSLNGVFHGSGLGHEVRVVAPFGPFAQQRADGPCHSCKQDRGARSAQPPGRSCAQRGQSDSTQGAGTGETGHRRPAAAARRAVIVPDHNMPSLPKMRSSERSQCS